MPGNLKPVPKGKKGKGLSKLTKACKKQNGFHEKRWKSY